MVEHVVLSVDNQFIRTCSIFLGALFLIISGRIHKSIVAICGAALMILTYTLEQHEALHIEELGVDWNVLGLLIGMMIIVETTGKTGLFKYLAIKSAKMCDADPLRILVFFSVITAIFSALLDNVTTVLLLVPVTLMIADALEIDAIPFLIIEVLASNIGGTATLIGDPPNTMIASKAKLSFLDFIIHLAPIVVVMMIVCVLLIKVFFGKRLRAKEERKALVMGMDEKKAIKDPVMLTKSLIVLGIVLIGFILHGKFHYQPATIAMSGAGLLLLLSGSGSKELKEVFSEIEWPVIFFFAGLFIMVGGLVKVGAIKMMSQEMLNFTDGNLFHTAMLITGFSAGMSGFVDNIPYVATMNPLVIDMARELWPHETGTQLLQHPELMPIWWSLALGSCLGGNLTPIGASANVIVVGLAEKAGHKISFPKFMAYGVPVTILTVFMAMIYVWLRYYYDWSIVWNTWTNLAVFI
ncbi:MAG: ArsB/NhaD family transporter [Candidatus Moranbacteria bacterium]|nr:ArsB/NhaD family transporter [Candidatus Moranbacteria bacterium]